MVEIIFDKDKGVGDLNIPTLASNSAIAVGFAGGDALLPFMSAIKSLMDGNNKDLKKVLKEVSNTQTEKIIKSNEKSNKTSVEVLDAIKDNQKSLQKIEEKTRDISKKSLEDRKEIKSYAMTFMDFATKALSKYMINFSKVTEMMRDLESSGVRLKEGYESVYNGALKANMTMDEFSGHLKKMSPLIAKLNANFSDGSKVFAETISNVSDNLLLTNDERVAIFENLVSNLSPNQLKLMNEQQLGIAFNNLARDMKMLSIATGKSVENITKENDFKNKELRIKAYMASRPNAANMISTLTSMGLGSNDWLDYFTSNGANMSTDIVTTIAGSEFLQATLPMIQKAFNSQTLNADTFSQLKNNYGNLLGNDFSRIHMYSGEAANMMAAAKSSNVQNLQFGALPLLTAISGLNNTNLNNYQSKGDRETQEALLAQRKFSENMNNINTLITDLASGGIKGAKEAFENLNPVISSSSRMLEKFNETLKENNLSGFWSGFAGTMLGMVAPTIGMYLTERAITSVGNIGKIASKKGKYGKKIKKVKKGIGKVATKGIGKIVGKGIGKSVLKKIPGISLLSGAMFGIQRFKNGDLLGGLGEIASGIAGNVPLIGTAISTGIDAALMAKDVGVFSSNNSRLKSFGGKAAGIASLAGMGYMAYNHYNNSIGQNEQMVNSDLIQKNIEHNYNVEKNINTVCVSLSNIIDLTKQTNDYLNKICNNGTYYAPYNSGLDYKSN